MIINDIIIEGKPTDMKCWDGYKKKGTKAGTGKNKGKRVNNCVPEDVAVDEHIKGGLDSYYELTKAKRLAKADGYDYDKLPEYDRGKDQPHKEKYKALAKEVTEEITLEDNQDFNDEFGVIGYSLCEKDTFEAEYQGRKVKLNKPMQGDTKKFKVYVKDPKTGNVKKVNFGHGGSSVKGKAMRIRKSNPKARKSFRARHNCSNPGPKTKARYWSCRKW